MMELGLDFGRKASTISQTSVVLFSSSRQISGPCFDLWQRQEI